MLVAMLGDLSKRLLGRVAAFVFHDEVRLFEIFSMLNLFAWAKVLLVQPDLLQHGAYRGFDAVSAILWAYFFGSVATLHLIAMLNHRRHRMELRFVAMALAAGSWTVIAWNFWAASLSTTANLNYTILALACAVSGAYLAWKSTSSQY